MAKTPENTPKWVGAAPTARPETDPQLAATATSGEEPGAASAELERGATLGRYTVLAKLGEGGMGIVYAAYDPDLDRKVALKLLRGAHESASEGARTRLLREARAMAKLAHPNVITVFEVGTVGNVDFVAMEFVDGVDLDEWCGTDGREWADVLRIFLQAGRGLAAAHRAGLVHRDFKPGNVLLRDGEVALVTDFGLATATEDVDQVSKTIDALRDVDNSNLTQTGAILGTPAYMSLEQFEGAAATELSDQFSYCVALYEALYGVRPFPGRTVDEIRANISAGDVAEPRRSDVPAPLRRAILRGLSAVPADRFASMDALLAELAKSTAGRRRYLAVAALVVLGIGAGVVAVVAGGDDAPPPCSDADERLRGVWDDDRRTKLGKAFGESGEFEGFAGVVDMYLGDWRKVYETSCRASHTGKRSRPEADHLLTLDCLLKRRDSLGKMLDVFASEKASGFDNAALAASSLPPVSVCENAEALRSGVKPPGGAEAVEKVAAIRAAIDEIKALGLALRVQEAADKADKAVVDARAVDYPPVLAEALVSRAETQSVTDPKKAIELLEEAVLVAEESGHDKLRARALVVLFQVQSRVSSDQAELDRLSRRAESAVQKHGRDDGMLGLLRFLQARRDMGRDRLESAEAQFEEALAIYQRVYGPEGLKVADMHNGLSAVAMRRSRVKKAMSHAEAALAIEARHHPSDHARVVLSTEGLAQTYWYAGDFDKAHELSLQTRGFWSSERGRKLIQDRFGDEAGDKIPKRMVKGRVVDSGGAPVAGASVLASTLLIADGKYLDFSAGGLIEARSRTVRATSDADGRFEIAAATDEDLFIAAEHADRGRSIPPVDAQLAKGEKDRTGLVLELVPFGRLEGTIAGAEQVKDIILLVGIIPKANLPRGLPVAQRVALDGRFSFERVPAGTYRLRLVRSNAQRAGMEYQEVAIRPGETARASLKAAAPGQRVEVVVKLKGGGTVTSAQVFLAEGTVNIEKAGKSADAALLSSNGLRQGFSNRAEPAVFTEVKPGPYSVCVVPLAGDIRDPDFVKAVVANREDVPFFCQPAAVTEGNPTAVVVEVERAYEPPPK